MSRHTLRTASFTPTPGTIADQLRQRLLALDYPAFARCICVLLETLGYEEVKLAGRQEWKGYNRPGGGGYDLEAVLPGGVSPHCVIAQIKQFDSLRVHQRSVDELRGACLRAGAVEGLLITTSAFSEVVRRRATPPSFTPSNLYDGLAAPVRLIDGQELLGLLIRHRIGVRENGGVQKYIGIRQHCLVGPHLALDEAFFAALSSIKSEPTQSDVIKSASTKSKQSKSDHAKSDHGLALPRWRLTVRIFPPHIFSPHIFSAHLFPASIFRHDRPETKRDNQVGGRNKDGRKKESRKKGGR